MSFTNDEDESGDGRMPPLTAKIIDIGVDFRDYEDGNEESRLIVLWKPDSDVFGVQTEILSNSSVLKVAQEPRVIRVGGSERGFDIEILGHAIQSGKLGYKAGLWMAKLKSLGVKTPGDSGNLKELIGVTAVIKQLTYNEVKGRPTKDREKPFWVPVEIVTSAEDQVPTSDEVKPVEEVVQLTLVEDIILTAEGLTEAKLVEWYEKSVHYDGSTVVPLFMALTELFATGAMREKDGKYTVGIQELVAASAAAGLHDDIGEIEEEGAPSSSNTLGGE